MLSTKRLFDDTPYSAQCQANILHVDDEYLILDQTLFYPLSGNQDCDTGTINGIEVTSVTVNDSAGGKLDFTAPIKHYLDTAGFSVGQQVACEVNRDRRLSTMKLHTASHLVEYFVRQMPTFLSVEGSFVNREKDRTDYLLSQNIDAQSLLALEGKVNGYISAAHPITFTIKNDMRIWCCGDIEMPCCGTHVASTAEVGKVKLSRKNKGKGLNRIEIVLV